MIAYQVENSLSVEDYLDVLTRSTLAERRPVDERQKLEAMVQNASLIVTARVEGHLVGLARALTDFAHCTYLADLAVDAAFQRQGIGKRLIHEIHHAAGRHTMLILIAAPKAVDYYPHIGMEQHDSCWVIPRG